MLSTIQKFFGLYLVFIRTAVSLLDLMREARVLAMEGAYPRTRNSWHRRCDCAFSDHDGPSTTISGESIPGLHRLSCRGCLLGLRFPWRFIYVNMLYAYSSDAHNADWSRSYRMPGAESFGSQTRLLISEAVVDVTLP